MDDAAERFEPGETKRDACSAQEAAAGREGGLSVHGFSECSIARGWRSVVASRQDILDDMAVHIGETEIAAGVMVSHALVVET